MSGAADRGLAAPVSDDLRLFVAVLAPPAVQATVAAVQTRLRHLPALRWSDPAGAHITLQFLGATRPERVPDLCVALAAVAAGQPSLQLRTGGLGAFPHSARARVLWLGLGSDVRRLAALQAAVLGATAPLGFAAEDRPFAPHLTLGRVRPTATAAERLAIGQALMTTQAPATDWPVTDLALMRSVLGEGGATYETISRWLLGGGHGARNASV